MDCCKDLHVPSFGWRRYGEGEGPSFLSGGYSVGCAEVEAPMPRGASCPVLVLYPSVDDASRGERPAWLTAEQTEQLRAQTELADALACGGSCGGCFPFVGDAVSLFVMRHLGPLATGSLRIPAAWGLQPAPLPDSRKTAGWPVAVLSHGLTGWPTMQSALAASLCSHGCVVLLMCHGDRGGADMQFADWAERRRTLLGRGLSDSAVQADNEAWRRSQNDQRVLEVTAALDSVNRLLRASDPRLFESFHACTSRDVAVAGQSLGGATAVACALRDGLSGAPRRFSHVFLFDPQIGGAHSPLSPSELAARPLGGGALRTLRIWLNEDSPVAKQSAAASAALVAKAKAAGVQISDVIHVPDSGHYAQTDLPTVFESGPFGVLCGIHTLFASALRSGSDGKGGGKGGGKGDFLPAREALRCSIAETLDPLIDEQWFAVGLAPIMP